MTSGKSVFIVGPGFIGWNVLDLLIAECYAVTGFVRRKEHGQQIQASGASPVYGDLNDKQFIKEQTLKHDIVIHTATADHLPSVEAILDGVRLRAEKGQTTTFIHTSGTSVLDDCAMGAFKSDRIYHDDVRSEVDSVSDSAPHREIDLAVVKCQRELGTKVKIAIIIPPLIYGFNPSHKRLSIQIPTLTRFALKHGYAAHVGKGLSVESNIHVLDLARAYMTVLKYMTGSAPVELLENPYFFCETTGDKEPSWYDVATLIGESLYQAGKIHSPEPKKIAQNLYGDLFGDFTEAVIGLNSRSRADRLRALGWEPREKDWKASYVEDELPELLKEDVGNFDGYKGIVPS
ncbi:related to Weak similarity to Y.pseudotuberculosis CDP-3,6-dideoxy-D-glycero-L-glycero-4-hexulose-5-epimerase [Ramularia collo-cygni]|uniref:Related to Weak similarity to Y.pseudotuberculosis CDP-3,6-dideoxy-D-glycero-L-glycero-4-hexulose-5-epimerase n=1 Tax=Ramularia collo-cygni TaxID=112498 RepID=A0A2D3V5R2_9PEZI|nr:related to Weak similarity to Y.pseudotuberculosis CDP-3,6-dideoxy-D-glycero-L-glycero-4-hexulose-5-epimerase [Ramularia collo-cygni]CZT22025.1 related to Weak similarity to Y.pseudotuberculosis CDP-3,6-dideoxy-D-glycero-L-glycero-4-hexulose-5-epimerase [Ramularia collo-cygni]